MFFSQATNGKKHTKTNILLFSADIHTYKLTFVSFFYVFFLNLSLSKLHYTQPVHLRRTRSTLGTTCTQRRASRLETWLGVLPSALTTASASSGLTTQGRSNLCPQLSLTYTKGWEVLAENF